MAFISYLSEAILYAYLIAWKDFLITRRQEKYQEAALVPRNSLSAVEELQNNLGI